MIGLLPLVVWGIYICRRHENKSTQKAIEKAVEEVEEVEEQPKKPEPIISSDPITAKEIIAFFDKNGCESYASLPDTKAYKSRDLKNDITIYLHLIDTESAFFTIYFGMESIIQDLSINEKMILENYVSDIENKSVNNLRQEFRKSLNS